MPRSARAKISFCIPTLNRLHTICACIDGILDQLSEGDDIVIVDGGSTDGTVDAIRNRYCDTSSVKVYEGLPGAGLGGDLMRAITYAQGDYCWLFSDDDLLAAGALDAVKSKLSAYSDLAGASTNYRSFDPELRFPLATVAALIGHDPNSDRLFTDPASCFRAFGMHLGYLTCQIVNRRKCLEVIAQKMVPYKVKSPWVVTYIVGHLQVLGTPWLYISDVCVINRTGNDSFLERMGEYKRQIITHVDFPAVIEDLFASDYSVVKSIRRSFLFRRMPRSIVRLKSRAPSLSLQFSLARLYFSCYGSYVIYWIIVIPMLLVPSIFYRHAVRLYYKSIS